MTQPPRTGQSAPTSTEFGSSSPAAGNGSAPAGNGSAPGGREWPRPDVSPESPTVALPVRSWEPTSAPDNRDTGSQDPTGPLATRPPSAPAAQGQSTHQGQSAQSAQSAPFRPPAVAPGGAAPVPFTSTPLNRTNPPGAPLVQGTAGSGRTPPPPSPAAGAATARTARSPRSRGPRRARLQLRHIDPWTVLKFSCVLAIALFFVWLIVIGVLYGVLDGAGIVDKINETVTTLQSGNAKPPITAKVVFGGAAIIGVVNIVLFIALSTVGAVVYNLCADLVGGIEITLSER